MSDQANKLGLGASDMFIASYQHYQVRLVACLTILFCFI